MAGPDLSVVTSVIDFGTVVTAVLGVAAALIVVYIAWKGAKMVIAAVSGGGSLSYEDRGFVEFSEEEYQSQWSGFDDSFKEFLRVSSYDDWRSRYKSWR